MGNTTEENMAPHIHGSVEVICGSMFSGKTDELIRRLRRATIARQHVQVFKPAIDMRYAVEKVTSHAGSDFAAIPIGKSAEIRQLLDKEATVRVAGCRFFFLRASLRKNVNAEKKEDQRPRRQRTFAAY